MNNSDDTISSSKEESIMKAFLKMQDDLKDEEEKNKIERPNINSKKIITRIVILVLLQLAVIVLSIFLHIKLMPKWSILIGIVILLFINLFTLKKTTIDMVLLYQKYAPEELRKACVFKPSCSEYMILAINKYGLIRGVFKGIKRILRCHSPNGGIDNP